VSGNRVSVLIPTRSRPDYLRRALQSVATQTAVRGIHEVVVIENGGDLRSQTVCEAFTDLPIRYVFNDPPVPMSHWADRVFGTPSSASEYIAFLCDDDWWYPGHLQTATTCLDVRPACVATWSRVLETNETLRAATVRGGTVWLVTNARGDESECEIDAAQMLTANLLTTAVHISGFVGRQSVIRTILPRLCNGNPFDIDRHLAVLMAVQGENVFLMSPTVGVRQHGLQESRTLGATREARTWWQTTTREIVALAEARDIDLSRELATLVERSPECMATLLRNSYFDGLSDVGTLLPLPQAVRSAQRWLLVARWMKRIVPPILLRVLGIRGWVDSAQGQPSLA